MPGGLPVLEQNEKKKKKRRRRKRRRRKRRPLLSAGGSGRREKVGVETTTKATTTTATTAMMRSALSLSSLLSLLPSSMRPFQGSASASCGERTAEASCVLKTSSSRPCPSLPRTQLNSVTRRKGRKKKKTTMIFFCSSFFLSPALWPLFFIRRRARRLKEKRSKTRAPRTQTTWHSTCLSFDPRERLDDLSGSPRERDQAAFGP